jgi:hypothetical protein
MHRERAGSGARFGQVQGDGWRQCRGDVKDQYYGDINDYRKYGLLRVLTGRGGPGLAVCWMLTPDDRGTDGRFTGYLEERERWRHHDPSLFDRLTDCVVRSGMRRVSCAETSGILPDAVFWARVLTDDGGEREDYFRGFKSAALGCQLVFFDPDNGIEVRSVPYGRKNSARYLYWRELIDTYRCGHSVLVYQHFPRVKRSAFVDALAESMSGEVGSPEIVSFRTARTVFFLAPQPAHLGYFLERCEEVPERWGSQIAVKRHECGATSGSGPTATSVVSGLREQADRSRFNQRCGGGTVRV